MTEPLAKAPAVGPSFDVVRVGEGGDMVVAGRAQPKAEVVLWADGRDLGRAAADERGEWVLVPTLPLGPGALSLSLEARNPNGETVRSMARVIVVVPAGTAQPPLALEAQGEGGSRLLLGPGGGDGGSVSVDLIDRDEAGALFIGGHAPAGVALQLYFDNTFLGRVQADAEGMWRLRAAGSVARGMVRADQVDERGMVRARVEVPVAPPTTEMSAGNDGVLVEPGASQWTIRRGQGGGGAYTIIYGADRERARDPGRQYPGQMTQLPKK
ncbi:MAG TPA: hypothetical protein VK196_06735 [Magnetospirillum sp.]|nr:hypothetical protein [Magnetospirillum sp.]